MTTHSDNSEFGFQIAPMLDVLFVLLLFFMVSAGMQKHEASISTQLPGKGPGPESNISVNLEIDADGQVTFNGAPIDTPVDHQLPETMTRLMAALSDAPERPVIISPALSARHQRVVDVLNACKAAHVINVAFGSLSN